MLKIAIQAKGRLNEQSIALLKDAGIKVDDSKRKLISKAKGFDLQVLYLRDDDIPQAVAAGVADIGIVGQNEVAERNKNVKEVMPLGFGGCRLSLALPKQAEYQGLEWFSNKRIATSYPEILSKYLKEQNINATICRIEGSVEIAPSIGMADAIFDIVSSGATLLSNGLVEVETVMETEAVLIANPDLDADKQEQLDELEFRFRSITESAGMKYVLMNLPTEQLDAAVRILPGMRSPTVLPLAQEGWCSIHAVIREDALWTTIRALKGIGAEGILVISLENMIK